MAKKAKKVPFDPKVFLATANGGRSLSKYRTNFSEDGKEAIVAVLGPDEFCGEGCLTGQPRRLATATAMTECEIMPLEKAAIVRVLQEEPARRIAVNVARLPELLGKAPVVSQRRTEPGRRDRCQ
jgi:CRP/FNR family transcriptional regulator, cyclic AMP receptor protein